MGCPDQSQCAALPSVLLPAQIATALSRISSLSPRELAVFELLGRGYDNRSVARILRVSERTAKRHVTAILAKLELESRLQAGLAALLALLWPEGRIDHHLVCEDTDSRPRRAVRLPGLRPQRSAGEEGPMSFDPLEVLREAGNPVDLLSAAQRQVFAQLSPEEVAVLNSIKKRLDDIPESDVEGHGDIKII